MKKQNLAAVIMAAGKGTRMRSDLPKVLHNFNGKPLLAHVLQLAHALQADPIISVVGFKAEQVRQAFSDQAMHFVLQEPQLGTGHAVMMAAPLLRDFSGAVLILSGDVPGLKRDTINNMLHMHRTQGNSLTVLGMRPSDPAAYGRLLVEGDRLLRIVEFRDASPEQRRIDLVNAGIYLAQAPALLAGLEEITTDNDQQEYYLTDLVDIMNQKALKVGYALCADPLEVAGVNSPEELRELETLLLKAK